MDKMVKNKNNLSISQVSPKLVQDSGILDRKRLNCLKNEKKNDIFFKPRAALIINAHMFVHQKSKFKKR